MLKGRTLITRTNRPCPRGLQLVSVPDSFNLRKPESMHLLSLTSAVEATATTLIDGGIRRGTDVLKALALGARCVFIGRPAMYGLAVGGEAGAARAIELLWREIDVDLALLGCPDIALLNPGHLVREDRLPC